MPPRRTSPSPLPSLRSDRPACDEASGVARLLRTADDGSRDALEVSWKDGLSVSLSVDGRPVIDGRWSVEISADGEPVGFGQPLECVLWHSDKDCDYLELQSLSEGRVLEFQVLLARQDRYAHLAAKYRGHDAREVGLTQRWSLPASVQPAPESETREIALREASAKPVQKVRAFPLSLAQDRWVSSPGQLSVAEHTLELRHVGPGRGAFVPLYLDWNPARRRAPADWRTLTVAQEGRRLSADEAVGHRIRIGLEHHVLVYHALQPSEIGHSVLGHNTRRETLIGLFSDCGNVETIMGVE